MKSQLKFVLIISAVLFILLVLTVFTKKWSAALALQDSFSLLIQDNEHYVQLHWAADPSRIVQGYQIYRSVSFSDQWEKLNEGVFPYTVFIDHSAPRPEIIQYRISSVDENGVELSRSKVERIVTVIPTVKNHSEIILDSNTRLLPAELQLDPAFVPGLALTWPLNRDDRGQLGNDYANYNTVVNGRYHTGIDLAAPEGTVVRAATAGRVVLIQQNDTTNQCGGKPGTGCEDHGYGTTIILRHETAGGPIYTQYSHLRSVSSNFLSTCGPIDNGKRLRRTCTNQISVDSGQTIAESGSTCYGKSGRDCGGAHLHFEVKTFDKLGTSGNESGFWGYTPNHPDQYGYRDPIVNLHPTMEVSPALRLRVTSQTDLRVGPGGSGSTAYRSIRKLATGETYDAIRRSPGFTTTPNCSNGWYQVRPTNGSTFVDTTFGGQIPEGWVCVDFVSGDCRTPVGQGASGTVLSAFQKAFNDAGGQAGLGCPTSIVQLDGFTSFTGTTSWYQSFTQGNIEYHTNNQRRGEAYAIVKPLSDKWRSLGLNRDNPLGYPIGVLSPQSTSCSGTNLRFQLFEGGALQYHLSGQRAGSVYAIYGAIYTKWGRSGFAACPLGLPISDEKDSPRSSVSQKTGRMSEFEGGHIYWIKQDDIAFITRGAIHQVYVSMGGPSSWLGFPRSDEYMAGGFPRSDFEGGYITTVDGKGYVAYRPGTGMSINLSAGYNLISLPLQPTDTRIVNVLSSIRGRFSNVMAYNTAKNSFDSYYPGIGGSLSTMESGRGYWIWMNEPAVLQVTGSSPAKTIRLQSGMNLVGYHGMAINTKDALSSISGKYDAIWGFDQTKATYLGYFPGAGGLLTRLEPNRGYYILVKQNVDWRLP